jgi:NAD(P)-dependent dehydrogenase (short-subunit alcohol dehydrogenase family)
VIVEAAMERVVVVTGVSSGIGNATARVLMGAGFRVFGSVRREADAHLLSAEWGPAFAPLVFDVTRPQEVQSAAEEARSLLGNGKVIGLVNNAGIAVAGPLAELPVEELRRQLEVNLVGVLSVTQAFLPLLREARIPGGMRPRIINVSSLSGKIALPFLGAYTAAKHGLEGLSDCLRRELVMEGVDVVKIDPGNVATPIYEKADSLVESAYARSPYLDAMNLAREIVVSEGRRGSPPERVGRLVLKVLNVRKPRPAYVIGSGFPLWMLRHAIPTRAADRLICSRFGLRRQPSTERPRSDRV